MHQITSQNNYYVPSIIIRHTKIINFLLLNEQRLLPKDNALGLQCLHEVLMAESVKFRVRCFRTRL